MIIPNAATLTEVVREYSALPEATKAFRRTHARAELTEAGFPSGEKDTDLQIDDYICAVMAGQATAAPLPPATV